MKLTTAQSRAVESLSKLILVIAGAGSGKTRVLVERIKRLIDSGTHPKWIVAITFTNAAADEMKHRLDHWRAGTGNALGYIGTVHGYMLRLLRSYGKSIGLSDALAVIDEQARGELLKEIVDELRYTDSHEAIMEVLKRGPIEVLSQTGWNDSQLVAKTYYVRMIQNGWLDFDMILHYGAELARKNIRVVSSQGEESLYHPARYLFVDEFQDSSNEEAEFYRLADVENKFFVGDTDQAIYSFRGGNVQNILNLGAMPEAEVILLEDNFRCDREVCDAANALIAHNKNRFDKITRAASTETGEVELWVEMPDDIYEAGKIATDILKHRTGTRDLPGPGEPSVAVLCRTNPIARTLATQLEAHGVKVSKKEFTRRPADWRLTKAAINFLVNPDNDRAAFEILRAIYGDSDALQRRIKAYTAFSTVNQIEGIAEYDTPVDAVTTFLARRLNIGAESRQLVTDAVSLLPDGANVSDLALAIAREEMRQSEVGEGVVVTTIHAAKGREWDHVYLPAFEKGTMPMGKGDLEEERRLAYVGITRARHRLVISQALLRRFEFGPRNGTPQTRSQFIDEIAQ